jgi:hypothetical protein
VVAFAGAVANECEECRMELRRWFIAACRKEKVLPGMEMQYEGRRNTIRNDSWQV